MRERGWRGERESEGGRDGGGGGQTETEAPREGGTEGKGERANKGGRAEGER